MDIKFILNTASELIRFMDLSSNNCIYTCSMDQIKLESESTCQ